jgi:hypothetical protein
VTPQVKAARMGAMAAPVVVLVTSNGTGMGHLTRQLTVALGLGDRAQCYVFSMSLAAPVIHSHGLTGEYCPSNDRNWIPRTMWNRYLHDRLVAFCREVDAEAVVFDGVAPYMGLINAKMSLPRIPFIWCRRGMWQAGANTRSIGVARFFDLIVEPGDLAAAADIGATSTLTDAVRVAPVTLNEVVESLPREEAARALGFDPTRPIALVTLGSGRHQDFTSPATVSLRALLTDSQWQIAVTRGIAKVGLPLIDAERVVELRDVYPLARYLSAFDAAVSAGGYNTVHEFIYAGIPTLLVPSVGHETDDQVARAMECARTGVALYAHPDDTDAVASQAAALLDPEVRKHLTLACEERRLVEPANGGSAMGREVLAAIERGANPITRSKERRRFIMVVRQVVLQMLGLRGANLVRRLLGKAPVDPRERPPRPDPMSVRLVRERVAALSVQEEGATPLLLTTQVDRALVRSGMPLEHVLDGTSPRYLMRRRSIAAKYYDIDKR